MGSLSHNLFWNINIYGYDLDSVSWMERERRIYKTEVFFFKGRVSSTLIHLKNSGSIIAIVLGYIFRKT